MQKSHRILWIQDISFLLSLFFQTLLLFDIVKTGNIESGVWHETQVQESNSGCCGYVVCALTIRPPGSLTSKKFLSTLQSVTSSHWTTILLCYHKHEQISCVVSFFATGVVLSPHLICTLILIFLPLMSVLHKSKNRDVWLNKCPE